MCKYFCVKYNLFFLFFLLFFSWEGFGITTDYDNQYVEISLPFPISSDVHIIFYQFGDGEYYIWQKDDLNNRNPLPIIHEYQERGTYTVEIWGIKYNDTQEPPERISIPPKTEKVTPPDFSSSITVQAGGGPVVGGSTMYRNTAPHQSTTYESSWNVVAGKDIFYIISVHNPCTKDAHYNISFEHDYRLHPSSPASDFYFYTDLDSDVIYQKNYSGIYTAPAKRIEWNSIFIPQGETRLFYAKLKADINLDTLNVITNTLNVKSKECSAGNKVDFSIPQTVRLSHDPNYKTVLSANKIFWSATNALTVKYLLEFQNLGAAGAKTIVIKDILDLSFADNVQATIDTTSVKWSKDGATGFHRSSDLLAKYGKPLSTNEYQWMLSYDNSGLRGKKESNYLHTFFEPATRDSLFFDVTYTFDPNSLHSCGMIFNQAEIIFDCNEIMHTNLSQIPISCDLNLDDVTCSEQDTTVLIPFNPEEPIDSINANDVLDSLISGSPSNNYSYQWYPNTLADQDSILNNLIPKVDTYYLVVGGSDNGGNCQRFVIKYILEKQCPDFDIVVKTKRACGNIPGSFEAYVDKPYPPNLLDYHWNYSCYDADVSAKDIITADVEVGKHFVELTNYKTGCSIRKEFMIKNCAASPSFDKYLVLLALAVVILILVLIKKYRDLPN